MTPFDIDKITRDNIKALSSYKVWRDEYLTQDDIVFLDNCENNYGSPIGKGYERYPSSSQTEIKKAIAQLKGTKDSQVVVGNGSDELIDLSIRCFCEPQQDSILICEPTFGMFSIYAKTNDINVLNAPLNQSDFSFNLELILKTKHDHTKLIFICSPNNPTGTSIKKEEVIQLCENFNGIVVLDEAYVDFSEKGSLLNLIDKIPNLLILQTFSKAWGLASLRLGVAFGNPEIISVLNKVRPPFNINGITQQLILQAIDKSSLKDNLIKNVLNQKAVLKKELLALSFVDKIIDSDANFFLIKVKDAKKGFEYLLSEGILISNRSSLLNCENHIRISIGTEEENKKLITALKKL